MTELELPDVEDLKHKRQFLDTFIGTPALENYVDSLLAGITHLSQQLQEARNDTAEKEIAEACSLLYDPARHGYESGSESEFPWLDELRALIAERDHPQTLLDEQRTARDATEKEYLAIVAGRDETIAAYQEHLRWAGQYVPTAHSEECRLSGEHVRMCPFYTPPGWAHPDDDFPPPPLPLESSDG